MAPRKSQRIGLWQGTKTALLIKVQELLKACCGCSQGPETVVSGVDGMGCSDFSRNHVLQHGRGLGVAVLGCQRWGGQNYKLLGEWCCGINTRVIPKSIC